MGMFIKHDTEVKAKATLHGLCVLFFPGDEPLSRAPSVGFHCGQLNGRAWFRRAGGVKRTKEGWG